MRRNLRIVSLLAALAAGVAQADTADGAGDIWVAIYDQPIKGVLSDISAAYGVPVIYDDTLKGRVRNVTGHFDVAALLTRVSAEAGLVWFDDGNGIHVAKSSDVRSFVIDTAQVSPDALTSSMQELGFYDPRFPMSLDARTGMGLVSGPPRYLELVRNAYAMLAKRKVDVPGPQKRRIAVMRGGSVRIWNGIVPRKDPAPAPAPTRTDPKTAVPPASDAAAATSETEAENG